MTRASWVSACGFDRTKLWKQWKALNSELRDSGRWSRDRWPTVKQHFVDVSSNLEKIWKKVTERSPGSGRRSRDRRPTVKQPILDVSRS